MLVDGVTVEFQLLGKPLQSGANSRADGHVHFN